MNARPQQTGDSEADFSVVIPAYGRTPYLVGLVEKLLAQRPIPKQIVIVHTGPHDPSSQLAALDCESSRVVRFIHEDERMFAGPARNRGVEEVSTAWVAFLDSDLLAGNDYSRAVADAIRAGSADCLIGSIDMANDGGYWGRCLWLIEFGSVHSYMPARSIGSGPSANMIVRRESFLRAGGFPDVSAGEDAACQSTIREQGGRVVFEPSIRAGHYMVSGFKPYVRHLVPLGAAAARVRRDFKLSGSRAASNPVLACGLWIARVGQIVSRVARYGAGWRIRFIVLAPGAILGLLIWNWGFLRKILSGEEPALNPEVAAK